MTEFEWEQVNRLREALRYLIGWVEASGGGAACGPILWDARAALDGFACSISEP